ncbi:hypothetical protein ACIQVR_30080 [Streptomyces xanthochromogenes]|uniref:hypothetical protein n=1 Tax=Streptomyces xanthochromogenes TaxID=67384 RepID=UPI0037F23B17
MAQQLTAYETLVMPDYGGFDLYDADCDAHDDNTLIPRARTQVAAGNGHEILVVCAQSRIKVRLHIETWTAQPPLPDEWEGHCDLRMEFPTGQLIISERTRGAWETTVPTGDHHARLSYRGRKTAEQAASSSVLPAELAPYEGTEEYLLQLWPMA